MHKETRKYVTSVLYERAVYAQEYNRKWSDFQWRVYRDFREHLRRYDWFTWWFSRFALLTFGIGMLLGIVVATVM